MDRYVERVMVTGSGCALVATVAVFDETVRSRIAGVFRGQGLAEVSILGGHVHRVVRSAMDTVGYTGTEEPTMVYFTVAAIVLFVAMVKVL